MRSISFALLVASLFLGTAPAWGQTVVEPPGFSLPRGFYSAPVSVTLTSPTGGASIRYTKDGTTPSPTVGTLYSGPVSVTTTTPLRAVAYVGADASAVITHTYVFLADVLHQPNNPPGYPSTFAANDGDGPYPADYEMDPQVVQDPVYAAALPGALRALPTLAVVTDVANLFSPATGIYYNPLEKTDLWERAVSAELILPDGTTGFALPAGARMHGQSSRNPAKNPKHSMRLYFRAALGAGKLEYPLFSGLDPVLNVGSAQSRFDRILLKGGNNASWTWYRSDQRDDADFANDEFARVAFRDMGGLAPHGARWVHLYLNGLYWGIYDITERVDEKYLVSYKGLTELDWDLITPDEDAVPAYAPTPVVGTMDAWNAAQALLASTPVTDATYAQAATLVDLQDLADYIILTHYVGNTDWPKHNWYTYRARTGADQRFKFIPWDNDTGLRGLTFDVSLKNEPSTPASLFLALITNDQFKRLVSERLALHTRGTGALTPARCASRYTALTNIVDQPVIAESARWGDYWRDVYQNGSVSLPAYLYTRNDFWLPVRDYKLATYCPRRTDVLVQQYTRNGWYTPPMDAPVFSRAGGAVPAGASVTITNPNASGAGDILYTASGQDPMDTLGHVVSGALTGGDSVTLPLTQVTTVVARIRNGAVWSPPTQATYFPPQDLSGLTINEIYYNPPAAAGLVDKEMQEFLELYNAGPTPLRLDGVNFSRGITYTFPLNTSLAPGAYLVLAADPTVFQSQRGFAPFGMYVGKLDNGGEALEILDPVGARVDFVNYDDAPTLTGELWPTAPDGTGPSLELRSATLDNNRAASWAASTVAGGTPGAANSVSGATGNLPPAVAITAPVYAQSLYTGDAVLVRATASDSDGTVALVAFTANNVALPGCTVLAPPYECTWTPAAAGTVSLVASAKDDTGNAGASAAVIVNVVARPPNQAPTVSITFPASGGSLFAGVSATVQVSAADSDGTVNQVVVLEDGNPVAGCTVTAAPFHCTYVPGPGSHTLTAVATDDDGAATTSAPVSITTLLPLGGGAFQAVGNLITVEAEHFHAKTDRSSAAWTEGAASGAVGTAVQATPNSGRSISSSNFSTAPELRYLVSFPLAGSYVLWLRGFAATSNDDSVNVGVNRAFQQTLYYAKTAVWMWKSVALTVPNAGIQELDLNMREDGAIVDRVVLTRDSAWRPSGTGPAESTRLGSVAANQPPSVELAQPADGALVLAGSSVSVTVNAVDPDGSVQEAALHVDGNALPACVMSGAPFQCSFTPAAGTHALTATATDDDNATGTSAPVSLTAASAFQATSGMLVLEAEHYATKVDRSGKAWSQTALSGAVGSVMAAGPNSGTSISTSSYGTAPQLRYLVNFPQAGTYALWLRGYAATSNDDSVNVGVDGTWQQTLYYAKTAAWMWKSVSVTVGSAGVHTLDLYMREDGAAVDRLVLTPDTAWRPSGTGPAESTQAP